MEGKKRRLAMGTAEMRAAALGLQAAEQSRSPIPILTPEQRAATRCALADLDNTFDVNELWGKLKLEDDKQTLPSDGR